MCLKHRKADKSPSTIEEAKGEKDSRADETEEVKAVTPRNESKEEIEGSEEV